MGRKRKNFDSAVKMYQDGLSIQDVADFYGVTRQSMYVALKRRKVEFRSQKKYKEENNFYRGGKSFHKNAERIVERAIRKNLIKRKESCQECGKSGGKYINGASSIHAHHCDYNKPLDVVWLCHKCHFAWHKKNKAIPFKKKQ